MGLDLTSFRSLVFSLVQVAIALLLLFFVIRLIFWLSSRSDKLHFVPFDTPSNEEHYTGRAITDALIAELEKTQQIFATEVSGVRSQKLPLLPQIAPSKEDIPGNLSNLGTVGFGTATVSIGHILLILKQLWPFGNSGTVITGSFQRHENSIRLVAHMESRDVRTWEVNRTVASDDEIPDLIRDLAFQILAFQFGRAIDPSPENHSVSAVMGFKHLIEAHEAFYQYTRSQQEQDLERATVSSRMAANIGASFPSLFDLLYNLGNVYLEKPDYAKAVELFTLATPLAHSEDLLSSVYLARASAYFEIGARVLQLGKYDDAIPWYQNAITLTQQSQGGAAASTMAALYRAGSLQQVGSAYDGLGYRDQAIDSYEQALATYKQCWELYGEQIERFKSVETIMVSRQDAMAKVVAARGEAIKGIFPTREEVFSAQQQTLATYSEHMSEKANEKLLLGAAYESLGYFDEALTAYRQAQTIYQQAQIDYKEALYTQHRAFKKVQKIHKKAKTIHQRLMKQSVPEGQESENAVEVYGQVTAQFQEKLVGLGGGIKELLEKVMITHREGLEKGMPAHLETLQKLDNSMAVHQRSIEAVLAMHRADIIPYTGNWASLREGIHQYRLAWAIFEGLVMALHASLASCYRKAGLTDKYAYHLKIAGDIVARTSEAFSLQQYQYNRACFEAIAGNPDEALAYLRAALEQGALGNDSSIRDWFVFDPDLEYIRDDPRFTELLREYSEDNTQGGNGQITQ